MKLWYWFLIVLLIVGLALLFAGSYYVQTGEKGRGWELMMYSVFPLGLLIAVVALYFERWRKRWWER
jgi:uncharacterized membrane protein YhaH (DUF805 family)